MVELLNDRLALLLAAACLLLGAHAALPRLFARPHTLTIERPDITVSVEGSVRNPGAYSVAFGARVADLIDLAGGLLPGAARNLIALAAPLTDGEVIVVPAAGTSTGAERISLNSAGAAELERLPGVGPAIAARIMAHRPFARINDLTRVPGIGSATLERLRPLVGL